MLTAEAARYLFRYEPSSGRLFWRQPTHPRIKIGAEAGSVVRLNGHRTSYRTCMVHGKRYLAHRVIWLMEYGKWPSLEIDHRDRDGLNNRLRNLRDVTHGVNQSNVRRREGGVYLGTGGTWIAEIKRDGVRRYLGSFPSKEEALAIRKQAEV